VPVYLSNEDYRGNGSAPAEERKELQRIVHETAIAKRSAGTVHVYIVKADGTAFDSMHVAEATKVDRLTSLLETCVARLHVPAGDPIGPPAVQSVGPKTKAGELLLHVVARNTIKSGSDYVAVKPRLGETRSGNWGAYPGENWLVLSAQDVARLVPAQAGEWWVIEPTVAERFLTYFYPSTENNDIKTHRIETLALKAERVGTDKGITRARLQGTLVMEHPFYHKADANKVSATLAGYIDFDSTSRQVRALRLVTEQATYAGRPFGVVLRSVP
jgi:hypothetical protein